MAAGAELERRRLFFSLWPSDEFCARVEAATRAVSRESGGRIIPPRNFHVTLLFLGEVLQSHIGAIRQAAAAVGGSGAFTLDFDRIEAWPGSKVLCLTPSNPPPAAARLSKELRCRLSPEQCRPGAREFRPHITLARDLPRIHAAAAIEPLRWKLNEFVLVESRRGAGGSNYALLGRWPLAVAPPSTS